MKFIHYGSRKFNEDKFINVKNYDGRCLPLKPLTGGMWFSPKDETNHFTWKMWCKGENYRIGYLRDSFEVDIDIKSKKILKIKRLKDVFKLKPYLRLEQSRINHLIEEFDYTEVKIKQSEKREIDRYIDHLKCLLDYNDDLDYKTYLGGTNLYIDFEKMSKDYDAFYLNEGSNYGLYKIFGCYDCDSLLVFNKKLLRK